MLVEKSDHHVDPVPRVALVYPKERAPLGDGLGRLDAALLRGVGGLHLIVRVRADAGHRAGHPLLLHG